jgi:hypothetical protein
MMCVEKMQHMIAGSAWKGSPEINNNFVWSCLHVQSEAAEKENNVMCICTDVLNIWSNDVECIWSSQFFVFFQTSGWNSTFSVWVALRSAYVYLEAWLICTIGTIRRLIFVLRSARQLAMLPLATYFCGARWCSVSSFVQHYYFKLD